MYATLTATGPVIRTITSPVVCWVLHTLSTQSAVQICIMEESEQSFLDEIQCGGNEKTLASCRWKTFNNRGCTYIGLTCSNSTGKRNRHHGYRIKYTSYL